MLERRALGPDAGALAKALGVGEDRVEKALETVRADETKRARERHDEFVATLAKELGIPESRVRNALPPLPGPGGPRP